MKNILKIILSISALTIAMSFFITVPPPQTAQANCSEGQISTQSGGCTYSEPTCSMSAVSYNANHSAGTVTWTTSGFVEHEYLNGSEITGTTNREYTATSDMRVTIKVTNPDYPNGTTCSTYIDITVPPAEEPNPYCFDFKTSQTKVKPGSNIVLDWQIQKQYLADSATITTSGGKTYQVNLSQSQNYQDEFGHTTVQLDRGNQDKKTTYTLTVKKGDYTHSCSSVTIEPELGELACDVFDISGTTTGPYGAYVQGTPMTFNWRAPNAISGTITATNGNWKTITPIQLGSDKFPTGSIASTAPAYNNETGSPSANQWDYELTVENDKGHRQTCKRRLYITTPPLTCQLININHKSIPDNNIYSTDDFISIQLPAMGRNDSSYPTRGVTYEAKYLKQASYSSYSLLDLWDSSILSQDLQGLTFNPATRTLSGKISEHGVYYFAIKAQHNNCNPALMLIKLSITDSCPRPTFAQNNYTQTIKTGAAIDFKIPNINNVTGYSYSGDLPATVKFDKTTGKFSGTINTAGEYTIQIRADNDCGNCLSTLTFKVTDDSKPAINAECSLTHTAPVCKKGTLKTGSMKGDKNIGWDWVCVRDNGGTDDTCHEDAPPKEKVDGICDNTVRNGCTKGQADDDAVKDTDDYYKWICKGLNNGKNSPECKIKKPATPIPGKCASALNTCADGTTPRNTGTADDTATEWKWQCAGINGSDVVDNCSLNKPVSGKCNLSVEKTASRNHAKKGNSITYTITVKNSSPDTECSNIRLTDKISSSLDYDMENIRSNLNGFTTVSKNSHEGVVWSGLNKLSPGTEISFSFPTTVGHNGNYTLENTVCATSPDQSDPTKVCATATTDIEKKSNGGGGTHIRRTPHGRRRVLVIIAPPQPTATMTSTMMKSAPTLITLSELPYTGPGDIIFFILVGLAWGLIIIYFLAGRRTKLAIRNTFKGLFIKKLVVSHKI